MNNDLSIIKLVLEATVPVQAVLVLLALLVLDLLLPRPTRPVERRRWGRRTTTTLAGTDGRIACWVNGHLAADYCNLRLRDVPELTIDRFGIGLHIKSNTIRENKKWYDDVVAAKSYIGPIKQTKAAKKK